MKVKNTFTFFVLFILAALPAVYATTSSQETMYYNIGPGPAGPTQVHYANYDLVVEDVEIIPGRTSGSNRGYITIRNTGQGTVQGVNLNFALDISKDANGRDPSRGHGEIYSVSSGSTIEIPPGEPYTMVMENVPGEYGTMKFPSPGVYYARAELRAIYDQDWVSNSIVYQDQKVSNNLLIKKFKVEQGTGTDYEVEPEFYYKPKYRKAVTKPLPAPAFECTIIDSIQEDGTRTFEGERSSFSVTALEIERGIKPRVVLNLNGKETGWLSQEDVVQIPGTPYHVRVGLIGREMLPQDAVVIDNVYDPNVEPNYINEVTLCFRMKDDVPQYHYDVISEQQEIRSYTCEEKCRAAFDQCLTSVQVENNGEYCKRQEELCMQRACGEERFVPRPYKESFEGSSTSCNNGCFARNGQDRCLPYMSRVIIDEIASYCSYENLFEPQKKAQATCQENAECASNACLSGKCQELGEQIASTQKDVKETKGFMAWLLSFFKKDKK